MRRAPGLSESTHGPDSGSRKTASSTCPMAVSCATPPTGSPDREGQCRSRHLSTGGGARPAGWRALALLGEPDIGKSTTLKEEADRVASLPAPSNLVSVYVDLRAYSSETL